MTLTKKLLLGFAVKLSVFIALLGVCYSTISEMVDARTLTLHTQEVIEKVNAVSTDLLNIETGQRGYALSGKDTYLQPLTLGLRTLPNDFDNLKTFTVDKPEQQAILDELGTAYRRWMETEIYPLLTLRAEVNAGTKPLKEVIDFIGSGNGKEQMDRIRAILSRITRFELLLLNDRQAELAKLTDRARHLLIFGGAGGILMGILVSLLTASSIKKPLADAVRYAEKVESGDFSTKLESRRTDEIGTLLSALRSMVDRLSDNIAKLKEQSELLDLAHDAIMVIDMSGKIIFWSSGAERTYGWSKDEALDQKPSQLLQAQYPEPLDSLIGKVISDGHWEGELRHVTRQGKPIFVESRWAVRLDAKGNPSGFLEINRDVTEHKEADRQIISYTRRLENSNAVLQDFAFVASHDLQEPLRKISIFGGMVRNDFSEALGSEGLQYMEKIENAVVRMRELIQSLLTYSRVTTKAEPFVPVDLKELVDDVIRDLEIPVQETGARVEVLDLPELDADPNQIRQLFQNLLGNALKFHNQEEPPVIRVYGQPCWGNSCRIFVQDNGIGFDEKYLGIIFQPFQRLHGRGSPYKGSGMGLAISRKIVERHSGTITAKSAPGKGSMFIITLPARQADESTEGLFAA